MDKPDDIPQDVWDKAWGAYFKRCDEAKRLAEHFEEIEVIDLLCRAVLAERDRCLTLIVHGAPHSPRRYIFDKDHDRRTWACDRLEASIRGE